MKHLFAFSLIFLLVFSARATHNRSGEILYSRIPPYFSGVGTNTVAVYTYSIVLIKYTDDGPGIADRCEDTISFGDGTKGLAFRINGTTGTCGCPSPNTCGALLVNTPGYKVKHNIYSVIHTYANAGGNYTIRYSDPNRNPGSNNIPNSGTEAFSIQSTIIINSTSGLNSSPVLTNPPIDQATVGVCFYHNLGATDSDGDSLSYSPLFCLGNNGYPITGYVYPGYGGQTYTFSAAGVLTWCVPPLIGEYNLAVTIKEWRKNASGVYQVIGYIMRDMQILVKAGVVGIEENNALTNATVYPNPFMRTLQIDLGEKEYTSVESTLYSADGKLVAKIVNENVKTSLDLTLNDLEPGIYSLRVKTENGTIHRKVIKN